MRGLEDVPVGGDAVPFADEQQVARHDRRAGNPHRHAVAHDERAWARQVAQRVQRPLGLPLLDERDADDDEAGADEREGIAHGAEDEIQATGREQEQQHRLAQHVLRDGQRVLRARRRQLIGPLAGEADVGLALRQSGQRRGHQARRRGRGAGGRASTAMCVSASTP